MRDTVTRFTVQQGQDVPAFSPTVCFLLCRRRGSWSTKQGYRLWSLTHLPRADKKQGYRLWSLTHLPGADTKQAPLKNNSPKQAESM